METIQKILVIALVLLASCSKEKEEFCANCEVIETQENLIELTDGCICFSEDIGRYKIRIISNDDFLYYCPCEFPDYFEITQYTPIRFSGYKTTSPVVISDSYEITCIRLDTIYYNE